MYSIQYNIRTYKSSIKCKVNINVSRLPQRFTSPPTPEKKRQKQKETMKNINYDEVGKKFQKTEFSKMF